MRGRQRKNPLNKYISRLLVHVVSRKTREQRARATCFALFRCMTVALFFVVKHHLADKSPRMKLRVGWDRKLFLVIILSVSFFYFLPTMTKYGRNHCNQHELLCCDEMKLPEINQIIGLFIVYILSANISVFVQSIQHPHPTTANWIFYKNTLEQMMDIIQWSVVYYKF